MTFQRNTDARPFCGIVVILALCFWGFVPSQKAYAGSGFVIAAAGKMDAGSQQDTVKLADLKGQAGHPVLIYLKLSPYPPPAGAFYTAIVDVLESPDGAKPEIVPGVPEISVRCPKPGIYRLRIRANLIEKSSCALADARILQEQEVRLTITP